MEARSTDKISFQLTDNGQHLGELRYDSFFHIKAALKLPDGYIYDIDSVGFFGTSIAVTKNGTDIATLQMNWRGDIVMAFPHQEEFILKAKGVFHNKYILENTKQEPLFQLNPIFNWSNFDYNYTIAYEQKPDDVVLVLLSIYASNYLLAYLSGAMYGMA